MKSSIPLSQSEQGQGRSQEGERPCHAITDNRCPQTPGSESQSPEAESITETDDVSAGTDDSIYAPDGGWGWMVTLASFMVAFIVDGIVTSFGLVLPELLTAFGAGVSLTSFPLAIIVAMFLLAGPFTAYLVKRWGCRQVGFCGGLLAALGMAASAYAPTIEVFILCFGVVAGRSRKRQVIVNENSPVIKAFRAYQTELDTKHDRYERLVKLSRDITIESKRAIFLLQRCAGEDFDEKQDVLQQAFTKLKEIQKTKFLPVALELEGHDHYQFIRAYSPGLQEYIEAVSFYQYLHNGELVTLSEVEKDLRFFRPLAHDCSQQKTDSGHGKEVHSTDVSSTSDSSMKSDIDISSKQGKEAGCTPTEVSSSSNTGSAMNSDTQDLMKSDINDIISVTVPPMEFMLGIADLTGELMRTAIMSVSAGNLDYPVQICKFMRIIHESFMSYGNAARELTRKMATLRQSLEKVENACYTLKVRGSEIPKHMLADIFTSPTVEGSFAEDMENSAYD